MRYRLRTLLIVLASVLAVALPGQDKNNPAEALYGEWEIVEMIHLATVQDLGVDGGSFFFVPGGFVYAVNKEMRDHVVRNRVRTKSFPKSLIEQCVVRSREIDITSKPFWSKQEKVL